MRDHGRCSWVDTMARDITMRHVQFMLGQRIGLIIARITGLIALTAIGIRRFIAGATAKRS